MGKRAPFVNVIGHYPTFYLGSMALVPYELIRVPVLPEPGLIMLGGIPLKLRRIVIACIGISSFK
jgi:hypothetical protein